jgi:hypothetical protein
MSVTGTQDSPVSLEHARPLIRRYLLSRQHEQAMQAFLKQSKVAAKITYVRDLAAPKAAMTGDAATSARGVLANGQPAPAPAPAVE